MYPYNPNDPFGNGQYPNQEDGSEDQGDHRNSYPGDGFVPFVTEPGGFTAPEFYPVDGTQIPYGASMQGYMSNPYVQSPFAPTMPVMVGFYDNNGFGYNQLMNALNASNTVSTGNSQFYLSERVRRVRRARVVCSRCYGLFFSSLPYSAWIEAIACH